MRSFSEQAKRGLMWPAIRSCSGRECPQSEQELPRSCSCWFRRKAAHSTAWCPYFFGRVGSPYPYVVCPHPGFNPSVANRTLPSPWEVPGCPQPDRSIELGRSIQWTPLSYRLFVDANVTAPFRRRLSGPTSVLFSARKGVRSRPFQRLREHLRAPTPFRSGVSPPRDSPLTNPRRSARLTNTQRWPHRLGK
jgi:hypothetical protein